MSTLSQFFGSGGGVKSVQTGYVESTTPITGTGEDGRYVNVSVSTVDPTKCVCFISGGASLTGSVSQGTLKSGPTGAVEVTARLTSSTNLRVSSPANYILFSFRYYVVEYA